MYVGKLNGHPVHDLFDKSSYHNNSKVIPAGRPQFEGPGQRLVSSAAEFPAAVGLVVRYSDEILAPYGKVYQGLPGQYINVTMQ